MVIQPYQAVSLTQGKIMFMQLMLLLCIGIRPLTSSPVYVWTSGKMYIFPNAWAQGVRKGKGVSSVVGEAAHAGCRRVALEAQYHFITDVAVPSSDQGLCWD